MVHVTEGNGAQGASGGGGGGGPAPSGGGGKKRNRNRNKNNKKKQQQQQQQQQSDVNEGGSTTTVTTSSAQGSDTSLEVVQQKPKREEKKKSSVPPESKPEQPKNPVELLAENLAQDREFVAKAYDMALIQAAEKNFYEKMAKVVAAKKSTNDSSEEVDLFASDSDESKEKPKKFKQQPKSKQEKKNKVVDDDNVTKVANKSTIESKKVAPESVQKNHEKSFIMLKPDAIHRHLVGELIKRFEAKGFKLIAMKFMKASRELLETHYSDLSKKPFFPHLIEYMSSGPVLPMVWEGLDIVKTGRLMLGATNPRDSAPGTIRGDYCIDVGRNIIHGSDSVEAAQREIDLWFSKDEVAFWRSSSVQWIYEDEGVDKGYVSPTPSVAPVPKSALAAEIAKARQHIKNSLECVDGLAALAGGTNPDLVNKLNALEEENKNLKKVTDDLRSLVLKLENRVAALEKGGKPIAAAPAPTPKTNGAKDEDDEDIDLFGSDSDEDEDAEKVRIREERLKAYHEKKAKKPALIAKTSVLFDIKPWDDETDMDAMLKCCKTIQKEGLVWGASKLVPVGYGINKLQLLAVVEDEKVSIDELSDLIQEFEDYVQSVDIAAMSKI